MTSYPDNQTLLSYDDAESFYCFEIFMPEVLNVTTWSQMNQVSAGVGLQKAENFSAEDLLYFLISGQFLHSLEVLEISRQKADGRFIMFSINNRETTTIEFPNLQYLGGIEGLGGELVSVSLSIRRPWLGGTRCPGWSCLPSCNSGLV